MTNRPNKMPSAEPQASAPSARAMQILIIDDNEVDRQRVRRLCKDAGLNFVATEVGSLAAMSVALAAEAFDLVFIDHLLAGEDGLDAVDILAGHPAQNAASIMIAGEGRVDIAVEAMRRGCSDYMTKSDMSVAALQKSVATALERRMMSFALHEERTARLALERAVRQYANTCSAEMRTILAGTLRRVRKIRDHSLGEDFASELGALEAGIDKLWDAMPAFAELTKATLADTEKAPLLPKQ